MIYIHIIFVLLSFLNHATSTATCVLQSDGSLPAAGLCSGPIERASLRYTLNNTNCLQDQVAFTIDGGSTWSCGSCNPGETGLGYTDIASELALALSLANYDPGTQSYPFQGSALFNCEINEVCSDSAVCIPLKSSPLYGSACPTELPSNGWCGPGLHCIRHKCVLCDEGAINPVRTRICINGEWSTSTWQISLQDPVFIILLCISLILLIQLCVSLIILFYKCWSNKEETHETIDLPHSDEDNHREYEQDEEFQQDYRRESRIPNIRHIWSKKKNIKLIKKV